MAWSRIALLLAADQGDDTLEAMAATFGYARDKPLRPKNPDDLDQNPTPGKQQSDGSDADNSDPLNTTEQRPSARFVRIRQRIRKPLPNPQRPAVLDSNRTLAVEQPGASWCFAPPSPLLRFERLAPLLYNSLGITRPGTRLNSRELSRQLARGKAIHQWRQLPRLHQRRWPRRLLVIVDGSHRVEPYHADFKHIVNRLHTILGREGLTALSFEEDSLSEAHPWVTPWPGQAHHVPQRWKAPAAQTAILLLGDFGQFASEYRPRLMWRYLSDRLAKHSGPILSLIPAQQSPTEKQWAQRFRPMALNDVRPPARQASRQPFKLNTAQQPIHEILVQLSVIPLCDAGLLRKLRRAFNWGGSELEGIIWNHPQIERIAIGIRLQPHCVNDYRQQYQLKYASSDSAQQLWRIVQDHHQNAYQGLRQLESFCQIVLEQQANDQQHQDLHDYLQRLSASSAQAITGSSRYVAFSNQLKTMLDSLPQTVWHSEFGMQAHLLFALAWQQEIRDGQWPDSVQPGFDPAQLRWLLDQQQSAQTQTWLLAQTGPQGQCSVQAENPTRSVTNPLAVFQVAPHLPLYTDWSPFDDALRQRIQKDTELTIPAGQQLRIQSIQETIELDSIDKPSWASAIQLDDVVLSAELVWRQRLYSMEWREQDNTGVWAWHSQSPFGFDDYGVYVDVQVKKITQRFRWIEPGQFMMGSPDHETGRFDNEILHRVTLTQGFWLAETAVTQEFYTSVTGSNPARFTEHSDNPVERVSWEDTQQFIEQLNTMLPGLKARLPSEAEWEYACRAGTETAFSFGDKVTTNQVNFDGDYPITGTPKGHNRGHTVSVKSLPANTWGSYQMHGNVWEWCQDWYGDYPTQTVIDPQGPESGHHRVFRGGSWIYFGRDARSACRNMHEPAFRDDSLGFRLALAPGQSAQGGGATGSGAPAAGNSGYGGTTPPERPAAGRSFIQALRRWLKQ